MARRKAGNSDPFNESAKLNRLSFDFYFDRLKELAISMFEWENLPDSMDERFLEMTLFEDGQAIVFRDDVMGMLGLQVMIGGPLNVYRVPINRRAYAVNGYQNPDLTPENSVIVFNNMLRTNSYRDVMFFARKLYEVDRAIDVNVKGQKTPKVILCDENERLTMLNLFMKYDGNQPFIFGTKNLDLKSIQTLDTSSPYLSDKLYQLKTQIWNEALTYLGISNVNFNKKERLVSDEALRNSGSTVSSRYTRLNMREKAADEINRMFGTDIRVKYREDVQIVDDGDMLSLEGGEETDE
nr:MAG TPA: upper collar protein [Caudoviricetes sp.]